MRQELQVARPLAQRRQRDRDDVEPVVEVLAELALRRRPRAGRGWSRRRRARRRRSGRCRRRGGPGAPGARAGAWPAAPAGARRSRRGTACRRRRPRSGRACARTAPVNAPFSWPNSSDSSSFSGSAAQLTGTNACVARGLLRVDRARDQLLAGAGLAEHQDVRIRAGRLADELEDLRHGRAAADRDFRSRASPAAARGGSGSRAGARAGAGRARPPRAAGPPRSSWASSRRPRP